MDHLHPQTQQSVIQLGIIGLILLVSSAWANRVEIYEAMKPAEVRQAEQVRQQLGLTPAKTKTTPSTRTFNNTFTPMEPNRMVNAPGQRQRQPLNHIPSL